MKVACELRALEPLPGSADADGGPAGAARTKCRGLSASEANAGTVLIEERAATLTQFLIAGLVLQSGEEANSPLVSQEVQEAHKECHGGFRRISTVPGFLTVRGVPF